MGKRIILGALLGCLLSGSGFSQVFKNGDLKISVLGERTWVVETSDNTTMYILEGNDKAMLIDTGTDCDRLDEVVRKITQKPLYVVITHAHIDHAGNMGYFDEVYLHPADTVLLGRLRSPYAGKIHYMQEGDVFDLGGRQIEVSHMPGHTPGSVVLLDRQTESCFSGDAFGSGMVWLQLRPYAPMRTYICSLEKMEQLMDEGITKIYCGHYPYVKRAFDKSYIIAMRELAEALDNGTATGAEPYPVHVDIGCENPMLVTKGDVGIVFDPDHIRF
jgi:hydroxyacylglutathione hydrolase